jgi:hypothetical protein
VVNKPWWEGTNMDIHNYKRRFERTIERIGESEDISKENKETMLNFKDYLLSENVGTAKIERYLYDLMKYSKMLNKSFEKASKEDIRRVVGEIKRGYFHRKIIHNYVDLLFHISYN